MSRSRIIFDVSLVTLVATLSFRADDALCGELIVTINASYVNPQDMTINVGDSITWQLVTDRSGFMVQEYFGEWSSPWITNGGHFTHTFLAAGNVVYQTGECGVPPPPGVSFCQGQLGVGTITVKAWTNSPPAITLNSPIEAFYYNPGAPVPLLASVTNQPADVLAVDFYSDGDWLGCVFTPPYQLDRYPPPGAHALTAQVTDMAGNVATSVPVNITVFPTFALFLFDLKRLADGAMLFHYAAPTDTPQWTVFVYAKLGGPRGGFVSGNYFGSGTALDTRATNQAVRFYQMSHAGP